MKEVYYNTTYQKAFKKNNCPEDLGSTELFVVPEAQFSSYVSQSDADRQAMEYAEAEGQSFANRFGRCCEVFYNQKQEGDFYRSCEEGMAQEEPTHYVIPSGTVDSLYDTEDANFKAEMMLKEKGQAEADKNGICKTLYYSEEQHGWFHKECRDGYRGPDKYRRLEAGAATSFISLEDANEKAREILDKEGQDYVDYYTKCEPIDSCFKSELEYE